MIIGLTACIPVETADNSTPKQDRTTEVISNTLVPTDTREPTLTPTPDYPLEGMGPTDFPEDVNSLTGLAVENPKLLNRRTIAVKVENMPRTDRPQSGLSFADIVYEYYTEFGSTRFIAIYYSQDIDRIGPVRSARHFDVNVVQSYKSVLLFGGAYFGVMNHLLSTDFSNRLVLEGPSSYPALYRDNSNGKNNLFVNTYELPNVLNKLSINNNHQNLDGMIFKKSLDASGLKALHVYIHYSMAVYNLWDFDAQSSKYTRYVDMHEAGNSDEEEYTVLRDHLTNQPITADNVVILFVEHRYVVKNATEEVLDMNLIGSGDALIARDGQIFPVQWKRDSSNALLTLFDANGQLFPFKPGNTWFEVVGLNSQVVNDDVNWRIDFMIP